MSPEDQPAPELADDPVSRLGTLGLDRLEARAYLALVPRPRSARELGKEIGVSPARASSLLGALTQRGLLKRLPGRTTLHAVVPPDLSLPALLRHRDHELEQTRRFVQELAHRYQRELGTGAHAEEYVAVTIGKDAVRAQHEELLHSAREEVATFVKAPIFDAKNPGARKGLRRGVTIRALWERELLESQGMVDAAREWAASGEEIRVIPSLPAKLVIVDGRVAMMNVTEPAGEGPAFAAMLTRHPEMVATLYLLFEQLWTQGLPVLESPSEADERPDRERLVAGLVAGLKDGTIGRHLGVSQRTVSRRVQDLMEELGVESRFQAGYVVGRRAGRRSDDDAV